MQIIFGKLAGVFQGLFTGSLSQESFNSTLSSYVLYFVYLAIAEFVSLRASMALCLLTRNVDPCLYLHCRIHLLVTLFSILVQKC
jgi:hypothetical protein